VPIDSRLIRVLAWGSFAVALTACGGGGGADSPPEERRLVVIYEPTREPTYETTGSAIALAGSSFTPQGSRCDAISGTLPPGYEVTWANETTGRSGRAEAMLGCLLLVRTTWGTVHAVGLVAGPNTIRVTAEDATGLSGSAVLVVTRIVP
jgi:hypothetical protein